MISIKYKECSTICMPDDRRTYDGSSKKLILTVAEIEFLYNLLDNIQVQGIKAIQTMHGLIEKVEEHYVPPEESED